MEQQSDAFTYWQQTITTREDGYKQVYALKLDGTNKETVENFAQTHVIGTSYSEEYGLASPDGTKVIFNSYWGNADKEVIDTYVAEVRQQISAFLNALIVFV